ncbi:amidohydrolase [Microcella humidisoli]|uniref:Amidohydrolase family protein n=1 Tax=Microcella humidisoli TaxID=2963406 RepID=A0ABY5FUS6_9MICO|nr:amidohydrolase family protein [Microcella humidisoli]UTT61931.1 amidohydrolase family protein [Microcella humidisoli]
MTRAIRNARPLGGHDPIDLLIDDGVIVGILPAGIEAAASDDLDLEGRFIMPGLWDEHVHLTQWAQHRRRIDLAPAESAAEAAAIVRSSLSRGAATDAVVVGVGFRDGLWPDAPNAALLDSVAPDRPIVLVSADVHCVWLNSAALVHFGVDSPSGADGDGVLREDAAFAITARLDSAPDAELDRWVAEAAAEAAARGVVGVVDLEMRWNRDDWARRVAAGFDALRVEFGVYPQHLDRAIELGLRSGQPLAGTVSVGPLKVITDGSLNTRTAYCCDPYPDAPAEAYGRLNVPPCELHPLLARGSEAGFELAVHAIGDGANRLALDVFAKLGRGGRIEHAQLVHDSDFARFAALGVTASVQPEHAVDDRDVAERYWPGRTRRAFALRSFLDAGARIVLGSDAPVAPLDPWVAIAAATSRTRDGRPAFHAEQSITVVEALAASTRSLVGLGEPADLVALDVDPLAVAPETLRTMPVALTMLAGRATHADAALRAGAALEV